ncbi:MAG: lytic transglycosylase [Acidobacteria bacterium]|nr:lytic transglycosylase [Acidobacteriota bacterium]
MSRRDGMTFRVLLLTLAGVLAGCVPARSPAFRNAFLPPGPKPPAPQAEAPDPPALEPFLSGAALPMALNGAEGSVVHGGRIEDLVRQAEAHYQAGRQLYLDGRSEAARVRFDQAVDVLLSAPERTPNRAVAEKKLEELVEAIHRLDLTGLGAGDTASEPGFQKAPLEEIPQLTFAVDPALRNKVLAEVRATVSQLPLEVNDAVLSYVQYFSSTRGRKIISFGLRRSGRYRPLIQRILDEEGLPQELLHVAQAESAFQPRAVSRARATGMWQFMRDRGRQYGLVQSTYYDDRLDPEKATRAAARHLRDLYHQFGDWYLALAAYNGGPGTVQRAVERTGYADFWEMRRRNVLPKETANYVPIILAMTIVSKNARDYGLDGLESDPPLEYDTIEITAPANLLLISDLAESTVAQIRELNPALLKNLAPEGYSLRVPRGSGPVVGATLPLIPAERRASWRVHRLGEGEGLAAVAQRYRTTQNSILAANRSLAGDMEAGDILLIPAADPPPKKAVPRKTAKRPAGRAPAAKTSLTQRAAK